MSSVVVHRRVVKYLRKLPSARRNRVKKALKQLEENPADITGVIQMSGEWAGYRRIQLGDLRVIYWFDKEKDIVYVDHVGPRGDIYK
jgi:mRNA interferase RelE/StbE